MSLQVIIYDYVEDNRDTGLVRNFIAEWMDTIGVRPKAKINAVLKNLSETPQAEWHKTKAAEKLKGQGDLWEIKAFASDVQWRPIGFFGPGPGTFTLLAGATEKDRKLLPLSVLETAQGRKANVQADQKRHRRRHVI
jgi:hypothetical protein